MSNEASNMTHSKSAVASSADYVSLARSALDLVNSTNPIHKLAHTIVRWIGREGINESDFNFCVESAQDVAFPNSQGLEIRKQILAGSNRVAKVGGVRLVASGAVGRWMAFTDGHTWMVTTVAAVTEHKRMDAAANILCEMILLSRRRSSDDADAQPHRAYSVERARLMAVLGKMVDSILLNVVNAGHSVPGLPDALKSLCAHLVDAETYARVALRISHAPSAVLLLCDRFSADLLLWALTHFEGGITVSAAGEQVFEKEGQEGKRSMKVVVRNKCLEDDDCHQICHSVELLELLGDQWIKTISARDDCSLKADSCHRLPLYELDAPSYSRRRDLLNREQTNKVWGLARRLVLWMLDVPLRTDVDYVEPTSPGFEAFPSGVLHDNDLRIEDILYRRPRMLLDPKGKHAGDVSPIAFVQVQSDASELSDAIYYEDYGSLFDLCQCFPAINDLLEEVSKCCNCRMCRNNARIDECKEGCLRDAVCCKLLTLVGNSVADSFGVLDASGISDIDEYVHGVRKILSQLVNGRVWWDDWFNIAGATALGYSPKGGLGSVHLDAGANALVAAQYGSTVVAARWLDLNQKIDLRRAFAVEIAEGRVPGVQDDLALIHTEVKMDVQCNLSAATKLDEQETEEAWQQVLAVADSDEVEINHAVIGTRNGYSIRLITLVTAGLSQRIIDPADALAAIFRSEHVETTSSSCKRHKEPLRVNTLGPDDAAGADSYLWSFESLLANWEIESKEFYFSSALDNLKINIAASLSPHGCVIRNPKSCMQCALQASEAPKGGIRRPILTRNATRMALSKRKS